MRCVLAALLMTGCASAAPVSRQGGEGSPANGTERDTKSEPAADTVRAPSWVVASAWATLGPAETLLPGVTASTTWVLDGEGMPTLISEVPAGRLTPKLAALRGRKVTAVTDSGTTCEVVLGRVVLGAQIDEDDSYPLFDSVIYDDEGNAIGERPEQERYAEVIKDQTLQVLVALETSKGERFTSCDENTSVHHVTPTPGTALVKAEADAALTARALAAFREHGFWEVQQAAYQRSVELLRESSRKAYEDEVAEARKRRAKKREIAEIERDRRADTAPATWEAEPVAGRDVDGEDATDYWGIQGPAASVWREGENVRFVVVELGNDVSCAAPRAWMLFQVESADLVVVDFGIAHAPFAIFERQGAYDVLSTWPPRVARIETRGLVTVAESPIDHGLHCSWGQIPPIQKEGETAPKQVVP